MNAEVKVLIDKSEYDNMKNLYDKLFSEKPAYDLNALAYLCVKREYPGYAIEIVRRDEIVERNDQLRRDNKQLHHQMIVALDEVRARDGKTVLHQVGRGFSGKELIPPDKNFWDKVKKWIYNTKENEPTI